ncbi:unnamed protein product [Moneuplotes crassus]|uniref:Uncharacterized protein n=1 Tax=Euplotes crassus TaxID=5936 RepID=A0AAD1Y2K0_EUPCR|nr:unnamed protein product [Moneuplotes crassus]
MGKNKKKNLQRKNSNDNTGSDDNTEHQSKELKSILKKGDDDHFEGLKNENVGIKQRVANSYVNINNQSELQNPSPFMEPEGLRQEQPSIAKDSWKQSEVSRFPKEENKMDLEDSEEEKIETTPDGGPDFDDHEFYGDYETPDSRYEIPQEPGITKIIVEPTSTLQAMINNPKEKIDFGNLKFDCTKCQRDDATDGNETDAFCIQCKSACKRPLQPIESIIGNVNKVELSKLSSSNSR